jgi:hypothetical protein
VNAGSAPPRFTSTSHPFSKVIHAALSSVVSRAALNESSQQEVENRSGGEAPGD